MPQRQGQQLPLENGAKSLRFRGLCPPHWVRNQIAVDLSGWQRHFAREICRFRREFCRGAAAFQDPIGPPMDTAPKSISAQDCPTDVSHQDMANCIRSLAMDAVQKAKSGHPGMPMGMADVATVLFTQFLKFDASAPDWPDRDRFVLSAGHGSMLLYGLLHLTGYPEMTMEELRNFRQLGSRTAGHPEYGHAPGIETTTGPLGQGLANAVGMALAERLANARYGDDLVDHFTYAITGDGCLMEGISHEAISLAGHLGLKKLIVLFDDNEISIDGPTSLSVGDDQVKRFEACGWDARRVDGHDPAAIAAAIAEAKASDRPSLIACKTVIGYGSPNKQGTSATHGAPLGEDEVAAARKLLDWPHPAFEIPAPILAAWRQVGGVTGDILGSMICLDGIYQHPDMSKIVYIIPALYFKRQGYPV